MDQTERDKLIKAALEAAVTGLNKSDISEEKILELLQLKPDTNVLTVRTSDIQVKVNTVFGSAAFIKESGPSWVEYKDHRAVGDWKWDPRVSEYSDPYGLDQSSEDLRS
jgi:hypothetical protein